jgi:ubiquinone/menaquinone biosynthesis C-methylase UbiE
MKDAVEKTIESYEAQAEEYARLRPGIEIIKDMADIFLARLKEDLILDVGCGNGRDAEYFIEHGKRVIGIDLTPSFISIAQKRAPKAMFKLMDMRKLAFPENTFDGIWSNASLLHITKKDAKDVLLGFYRILKPKGLLFIGVKQGDGEKFLFEDNVERFYAFYTQEELEQLITNAGFNLLETNITKRNSTVWIRVFANKP